MKVVTVIHEMIFTAGARSSRFPLFALASLLLLLIVPIFVSLWFLVSCKTSCRLAFLELPEAHTVAELVDDGVEIGDLLDALRPVVVEFV